MVAGWHKKSLLLVALALLAVGVTGRLLADDEEVAVERTYVKDAGRAAGARARQRPTPRARAAFPATPSPTRPPCMTMSRWCWAAPTAMAATPP